MPAAREASRTARMPSDTALSFWMSLDSRRQPQLPVPTAGVFMRPSLLSR